jgi:hypothetical protein
LILGTADPNQNPVDGLKAGKAELGDPDRSAAIIAELLANPPPLQVLDEAYRMWLRKLIVASGEG